ncbi:putative amidase [Trichoderma barbatum]
MADRRPGVMSHWLQYLGLSTAKVEASHLSHEPLEDLHTALREIDLLKTTATDLKDMLSKGLITSRAIVQVYVRQIRQHNSQGMLLNALIDVAPEEALLGFADVLDAERAAGNLRGHYHGIPIVLKDTINTDPSLGMRITLGSYAMASAKPAKSALVVDVLLKYGLTVLAKEDLSEIGTNKGACPTTGLRLEARPNPLISLGESYLVILNSDISMPGGSSSGSAVSVAAGITLWSIGAETDGSIQTPASRASLYALKPTIGIVSGDGVFKLTNAFDSLGGMAITAQDLAALTEIIFLTVPSSPLAGKSLTMEFTGSLNGLRLGFVDVNDWMIPQTMLQTDDMYLQQRRTHWNHAISELNRLGAKIISPVEIKKPSEYTFQSKSSYQVIRYGGWKRLVTDYLHDLAESEVYSLEDIVKFSEKNPRLEFSDVCPNQTSLINALKYNIPPSVVDDAIRDVRQAAGPDGIDRVLEEYGVDAIIAPTETEIHKIASFAGYPIGTMHLGYLLPSGRPHGLSILSSKSNDALILV